MLVTRRLTLYPRPPIPGKPRLPSLPPKTRPTMNKIGLVSWERRKMVALSTPAPFWKMLRIKALAVREETRLPRNAADYRTNKPQQKRVKPKKFDKET